LREIAAASDFDFVASEPAPAAKRPRAAKSRAKPARAPWLGRLWVWRTPLFGGAAFVLLLAAIGVNAMFLQHGRHPAPLMGSILRVDPPTVEKPSASPLVSPPAAVARAEAPVATPEDFAPAPLVKPAPQTKAKPAPATPAAAPAPAAKPRQADAIGALMSKSADKPADKPAAAVPAAAVPAPAVPAPAIPAKTVVAAQKALNKLGAHVQANGKYDDATRKAIQKFQRDNGLPVTGELTPKLRQFLALQAGLPGG